MGITPYAAGSGDRAPCIWCDGPMNTEWAEPNQKFCSRRCRNAEWYVRHKDYHRKLYAEHQRQWERSQSGRRGGVSIHQWLKLPRDWR